MSLNILNVTRHPWLIKYERFYEYANEPRLHLLTQLRLHWLTITHWSDWLQIFFFKFRNLEEMLSVVCRINQKMLKCHINNNPEKLLIFQWSLTVIYFQFPFLCKISKSIMKTFFLWVLSESMNRPQKENEQTKTVNEFNGSLIEAFYF